MKVLYYLALLPLVASQCPAPEAVDPCRCTQMGGEEKLHCWGGVSLPRLTTILRVSMCGRRVVKFELLGFNVTYLPSNLFSKIAVTDIVVYSGTIVRFTEGGRSAFYGLEDTLKSLSMRRCGLKDDLQWQLLGDMHALSYLDLSYNRLRNVPGQWSLTPPPNLRSLILKGNMISTLPPGALQHLYGLVELDLSENHLRHYDRLALAPSANSLVILRLSYNNLEYLPDDSFHEMYGLRRIYLDHNNLSTLEENTWRPVWGDLEVLDLNDNAIVCGSSSRWIAKLKQPLRLYGECRRSPAKRTLDSL